MTSNAIVVMLYVELGIFVGGIAALLVQQRLRRGRVSEATEIPTGEKRDLVLSRMGA